VLIAAALAAGVATAAAVADRQQRIEDLRASAFNALDGWLSAHGLLQQRLSSGDFSGAARIAIGPEPSGATAHFLALNAALQAEITRLRAVEFDSTTTAYRALSLLSPGGAALGVLCALGVVQRVMPAATVLAVPNLDDCLLSIQQGRVDAVSTDDSVLALRGHGPGGQPAPADIPGLSAWKAALPGPR
jgi:hypothetical protein